MPLHLLFLLPVTLFLNIHTSPHISLRFILKGLISKAFSDYRASLVAQLVKNLPVIKLTLVQFLGQKDPLEKGKTTHSSILVWIIPWIVVYGVAKSWTQLSDFHFHFSLTMLYNVTGPILILPPPLSVSFTFIIFIVT